MRHNLSYLVVKKDEAFVKETTERRQCCLLYLELIENLLQVLRIFYQILVDYAHLLGKDRLRE